MMAATLATIPQRQALPGEPASSLRIGMIAPPYFTVPPDGYGGVEAMVANLVDGLVERGHHVTLIGAGGHATRAQRFLSTTQRPPAERLGEVLPEVTHAARAAQLLESCDVDIVHDHTCAGPLLARGRMAPTVVTVHGPVSGDEGDYYSALADTADLVAISDSQRASAPDLAWLATVHNAIDAAAFPYEPAKDGFALFLGRFHPHKAPHLAIDAARAAGLPIVLAGKCSEPFEREYFEANVAPRLGPDTTLLGVADAGTKRDLLARAACLLFPIQWPEPFGLVMVEAMACGTPVVALRRGSVPELVVDGRTGIICEAPEQLADAIHAARRLDPLDCREHVEHHFDVPPMAAAYEQAYRRVLADIAEPTVLPTRSPPSVGDAGDPLAPGLPAAADGGGMSTAS